MKSSVRKGILLTVLCLPILAFCVRYVTRLEQLEVVNRYLTRAKNNWLGEKWIFPPGSGNETNRFKGIDDVYSVSFHVNGEPGSNVVVTSSGGARIDMGDYKITVTPVASDFDYVDSVYYTIESEQAAYPTLAQILFAEQKDFDRAEELLRTKVAVPMAISNKIHVIEKPPYKGIAYQLGGDSETNVFLMMDDGKTNRCCSLFVYGFVGYPRKALEGICREIISTFEFYPDSAWESEIQE